MKLIKISIIVLLFVICTYGNNKYINPSIKFGTNINWLEVTNCSPDGSKKYFYQKPIIGISNNIKFSKYIFLQNDLNFIDSYTVYRYNPIGLSNTYVHFNNKVIQFSTLPGIKIRDYLKISTGIEMEISIKTDYYITESKMNANKFYNLKTKVQKFGCALSTALSKDLNIKNFKLYIETRFVYSLPEISSEYDNTKYRNHKVYFMLGYSL